MTIELKVTVPHGAPMTQVEQYIKDALGSWGGGGHPEDALFNGIVVRHVRVI